MQADDQTPTPPEGPLTPRVLHCWADYSNCLYAGLAPFYADLYSVGGTCLLPSDHIGPHEFTRDDEILVTFAPRKEP
jgi:hypothetical protein